MRWWSKTWRRLSGSTGASMTEYALALVLLAIAVLACASWLAGCFQALLNLSTQSI